MNMKEKNWYVVEEYAFNEYDEQCFKYESEEAAREAIKKHLWDTLKVLKEDGAKIVDINIGNNWCSALYKDGRFKIYVAER